MREANTFLIYFKFFLLLLIFVLAAKEFDDWARIQNE